MWMTSDGSRKVEVEPDRFVVYGWVAFADKWAWLAESIVTDPSAAEARRRAIGCLSRYVDLAELDEYPSVDLQR